MTERERYQARLGEARDAGLVDVKFFFRSDRPVKPEDIYASLNEIEEAIKHGSCIRHKHWSGDKAIA